MARWIGLRIGLSGILLLAALAPVVRADDSVSTTPSVSTSPSSPRYPKGFGSSDDHVEKAAYESPLDHRTNADSQKRSDVRPPTSDLRSPTSEPQTPIGGAAHGGSDAASRGARHELPPTPSTGPALLSMFGSLAIVLTLFFGLVWLLRRGMPRGSRIVPSEVVEVLGRAPLAGRQQMHVVRFGNKVLLIAVTPAGAETLSEITEPAEVDRLSGICQQIHAHSATNAFRQVFRQFAEDRSPLRRSSTRRTVGESLGSSANPMEGDDV
ncbi:MAG TPA: flagellar biosynthetic protein FliO [Pirellulales bacterium]